MTSIILFAPLVGALICGFGWKLIGERTGQVITTGLVFLGALLSWILFLSPTGPTEHHEILRWIEADSPAYARAVAQRVLHRTDSLRDQPRQGRRVPEHDGPEELREVFVHRWRIIYLVEEEAVNIVTIVHGARDIGEPATE